MPKFRTTLLQGGKTAVGMVVPPEIVEALGAGKRPPVRITINGYSYRNTVAVMGGKFMVGVSAEHRAGADVKGGDEVEVGIELDTAPREVSVPADLRQGARRRRQGEAGFRQAVVQQPAAPRAVGRRHQEPRDARPPHCQGGRDAARRGPLKAKPSPRLDLAAFDPKWTIALIHGKMRPLSLPEHH